MVLNQDYYLGWPKDITSSDQGSPLFPKQRNYKKLLTPYTLLLECGCLFLLSGENPSSRRSRSVGRMIVEVIFLADKLLCFNHYTTGRNWWR